MSVAPVVRPAPKVNDAFWFTYSETMVTQSQAAREKAAEKLQALAVWLWGIYTTYAAVGFALAKHALSGWEKLLVISASAALIAVYWGATWVHMPVVVRFDPRAPEDIRNAYDLSVKVKHTRLWWTLLWSVIAAGLVAMAIITVSLAQEKPTEAPPKELQIQALTHKRKTGLSLAVTCYVGKVNEAEIQTDPPSAEEAKSYIPAEDGLIQASLLIPSEPNEVIVNVKWVDKSGMTMQMSRTVKPPS